MGARHAAAATLLVVALLLAPSSWESSSSSSMLAMAKKKKDKALFDKIKKASEDQEYREPLRENVTSHLVEEAEAATLANGDGDVSTINNCSIDIDVFCTNVQPGEGRIAKCLSQQLEEETLGNAQGRTVSDGCKLELRGFKISRSQNINLNVPYASACAEDITDKCGDLIYEDGDTSIQIQDCLRRNKYRVDATCRKELTNVLLEQAKDFTMNAELYYYCGDDAERLCSGVRDAMDGVGGGEVQACLMRNRRKLEWECDEALFKTISENADDMRLVSYQMYKTCLEDKKRFCKEVEFGHARTQACLEAHIAEDDFSVGCRKELTFFMEQRNVNWQWDAELKEGCMREIPDLCGYTDDEYNEEFQFEEEPVMNCLEDYREDVQVSAPPPTTPS